MLHNHSDGHTDAEDGVEEPQNGEDPGPIRGKDRIVPEGEDQGEDHAPGNDGLRACPHRPRRPHDDEQGLPADEQEFQRKDQRYACEQKHDVHFVCSEQGYQAEYEKEDRNIQQHESCGACVEGCSFGFLLMNP